MLLEIKKVWEKLISSYIPYWITIVVPKTFFPARDFSNPPKGYHGTTVNQWIPRSGQSHRSPYSRSPRKYLMQRIPEIAEVDVSDPDDLIDEGDGFSNFGVIFWAKWLTKDEKMMAMVGWYGSFLSGNLDVQTWSNLPTTAFWGSNPRVLLRLSFDLYLDDKADNALPVVFPNVYQGCVLGVRYHFSSRFWLYGEVTVLMNQPVGSDNWSLVIGDHEGEQDVWEAESDPKKLFWMFLKTVVRLLTIGRLPWTSQIDIDDMPLIGPWKSTFHHPDSNPD